MARIGQALKVENQDFPSEQVAFPKQIRLASLGDFIWQGYHAASQTIQTHSKLWTAVNS
jgi:hypothetical protein